MFFMCRIRVHIIDISSCQSVVMNILWYYVYSCVFQILVSSGCTRAEGAAYRAQLMVLFRTLYWHTAITLCRLFPRPKSSFTVKYIRDKGEMVSQFEHERGYK